MSIEEHSPQAPELVGWSYSLKPADAEVTLTASSRACASLRSAVLEQARKERSPTRAETLVRQRIIGAILVCLPIGLFIALSGVRIAPRPVALVLQTVAGSSLVAMGAALLTFRRGGSMLGRPAVWLLAVVVISPALLLAWKIWVSLGYPQMMVEWGERPGFRCLGMSCLLSGWALLGAILIRRAADPVHPRLTGAAIGAAVGSCTWVLVDLWCPVAYLPHLLLGHVLPLAVGILVGAFLGGRYWALRRWHTK